VIAIDDAGAGALGEAPHIGQGADFGVIVKAEDGRLFVPFEMGEGQAFLVLEGRLEACHAAVCLVLDAWKKERDFNFECLFSHVGEPPVLIGVWASSHSSQRGAGAHPTGPRPVASAGPKG
jgi:hypothetical protein